MELKHKTEHRYRRTPSLLIVPYGIETCEIVHAILNDNLLIVPYGIETP